MGLPSGSDGKEPACNAGDLGLIPGGGHGNPLQYCCLENPHGQSSLAGWSPYGHTEPDPTEASRQQCMYVISNLPTHHTLPFPPHVHSPLL